MKKQVSDFVKSLNGETKYSGNTKTMYIPENLHYQVIEKFGFNLPFKLGIL